MSTSLYKTDSPSAYYMSCMTVEPTTIFKARYNDLNEEGLDLLANVYERVGRREFKGTLKGAVLVPKRTGSLWFNKEDPMYTKYFEGSCDILCAMGDRFVQGTDEKGNNIHTSLVRFFSIEDDKGDEDGDEEETPIDEKWGWAYTMSGSLYKVQWAMDK
jgi:hypothetical protein